MTRKDYVLIAQAIRYQVSNYQGHKLELAAIEDVARQIARELGKDNPRFDMPRFFAACGF